MEDDDGKSWTFTSRSYHQSNRKLYSDLCIDFEEIEEEEDDDDDDDEFKTEEEEEEEEVEKEYEYPCPYCSEDFDLVGLCCHIDEEHPQDALSGVCPVCASWIGMNLIGHIAAHGNMFKSRQKSKYHKDKSYSSFLRKELQDAHFQSLVSETQSKMALDPLLSFINNNMPVANESKLESSTKSNLEEKASCEKAIEKDVDVSPVSDEVNQEKLKRCEFVQGLLFSTLLDDDGL